MLSLRARFPPIFARLQRGESSEALAELEAMRAEALADGDAANRATFWATFANALDNVGQSEEALDAAERALALDDQLGLRSRGAYFSLHSIVIILRRLGRREEAANRAKELLAVGERLGSTDFADAAVHAAIDMPDAEARPLLERARFACEVTHRERNPKGAALFELTVAWGRAAIALGNLYARLGNLERAERAIGEVTPLLADTLSFASSRRNLGIAWFQLAAVAGRRNARGEERYDYRAALDVFTAEADKKPANAALVRAGGPARNDEVSLDVFRVLRVSEGSLVVAQAKRGWFSVARDLAGDVAPFDAVDVTFGAGRAVRSIRKRKA